MENNHIDQIINIAKDLQRSLDNARVRTFTDQKELEELREEREMLDWVISNRVYVLEDEGWFYVFVGSLCGPSASGQTPREAIKEAMSSGVKL